MIVGLTKCKPSTILNTQIVCWSDTLLSIRGGPLSAKLGYCLISHTAHELFFNYQFFPVWDSKSCECIVLTFGDKNESKPQICTSCCTGSFNLQYSILKLQ